MEHFVFKRRREGCYILIWAGFEGQEKTYIVFLNNHTSSKDYQTLFTDPLLPVSEDIGGQRFMFQQDRSPVNHKHTNSTFVCFLAPGVHII